MKRWMLMAVLLLPLTVLAASSVVDELLAGYEADGAGNFSSERGSRIWNSTHQHPDSGKAVSCATCHGSDLTRPGRHVRTGKAIGAMAPSVNPERLTDAAKINKWLLRNCKWTLGRECTLQEKGDLLTYIQSL